ncbi:hypothetical protein FJY93_03530 [Candidatus Kaiserbacteria bacterium]|nr:hypothetical protein [Candidatus Kaiserbacteria bacterium]
MKGPVTIHLHRRKRGKKPSDPYPAPNFWIRLLDRTAIVAGFIGPIMTLPQIGEIYYFHNAAGVSALSWGAFAVLDLPFILYGFVHKNTLIKITYIGWLVANTAVAVGAIIYQ